MVNYDRLARGGRHVSFSLTWTRHGVSTPHSPFQRWRHAPTTRHNTNLFAPLRITRHSVTQGSYTESMLLVSPYSHLELPEGRILAVLQGVRNVASQPGSKNELIDPSFAWPSHSSNISYAEFLIQVRLSPPKDKNDPFSFLEPNFLLFQASVFVSQHQACAHRARGPSDSAIRVLDDNGIHPHSQPYFKASTSSCPEQAAHSWPPWVPPRSHGTPPYVGRQTWQHLSYQQGPPVRRSHLPAYKQSIDSLLSLDAYRACI